MSTHVLIHGNPIDGLNLIGPLDGSAAAIQLGEQSGFDYWWVAQLEPPGKRYRDPQGTAVVVHGTPFDGLAIVGPFHDTDAAINYAEKEGFENWWAPDLVAATEIDAGPSP